MKRFSIIGGLVIGAALMSAGCGSTTGSTADTLASSLQAKAGGGAFTCEEFTANADLIAYRCTRPWTENDYWLDTYDVRVTKAYQKTQGDKGTFTILAQKRLPA